jgi:hypothetical protein
MLAAPSNYCVYGQKAPVRVMRGFYPETRLFFKLTVVQNNKGTWAKATVPIPRVKKAKLTYGMLTFDGIELSQRLTSKLENALLEAGHVMEPLVPMPARMPRCMSPKGIKVFNMKKGA